MTLSKNQLYFIYIIIAIGIFLRLVWVSDMEWKDDEQWTYSHGREIANSGHYPEVGMQSGGGIVNPGMSVWVFAGIAAFTNDPPAMNRVVQIINILSLLGFLFFALKRVDVEEREIWLLGIALAAVSPLAVIFSRKIWAQDLLPLLSIIIIFTHSYRHKGWCAFLWGVFGALLGQIHMSGFFFAAGLFVFTVLHDHYNKIKFRWSYWIAGSIIGSLAMVPWIIFILQNPQINRQSFWHIFQFNFYLYWLLDPFGLNIMYSMRKEFWQFIKEPIVAGVPTYLISIAHLFLVTTGILALIEVWKYIKKGVHIIKAKTSLARLFLNLSTTKFYLFSILLGLGVFMTLSGATIHPHYLICAFPFSYIFLAKMLQHRKQLFRGIILAQLVITVTFLFYVHTHHGIEQGDYKKTYREQVK